MHTPAPTPENAWAPLDAESVAALLGSTSARWWLSGGVALDRWIGEPIRERSNTDVSTTSGDLVHFVADLPATVSAWVDVEGRLIPWVDAPTDIDLQPVRIRDDSTGVWVLQVNVEDGSDRAWVYRRDPRLQVPWEIAVEGIRGIPTGVPQIQLVWKALRPRPEDDIDKDAVLPLLSEDARAWWKKAILSIHPHSAWAIPLRSPTFPAKASWNRPQR